MRKNVSLATVGIVIGWGFLVIAGVRGVEMGVGFARRQAEQLSQQRERLMRLQGWLQAEEKMQARRRELLGRLQEQAPAERETGWAALQGLQEMAQAKGLAVTDLRPSQVRGQGKKRPVFRLDAKIEGDLGQIDGLLQELPQALPGVRLENLQLVPQEDGKIQGLLRMEWAG